MSNLRERAKDIKAQGVAQRGNFNPSGAPLKMYNFWLNRSESRRANAIKCGSRRENFCHFWRVVAIWAPLMAIGILVIGFFEATIGKVISAVAAATILVTLFVLSPNVRLGAAVVLGVFLVTGLLVGAGLLIQKHWPRKWNKPIGKFFAKATPLFLAAAAGSVIVFILVLGVIDFGWIFLLWVLGGLGLIGGAVYGFACLADYVSGIRADKARRRQEFFENMTEQEYIEYVEERRKPSKIGKFFSGVGDFIVFVAQIVRVNKWKICPIVTIEDNNV